MASCRSGSDAQDLRQAERIVRERRARERLESTRKVVVTDPVTKRTLEVHELARLEDGWEVPSGHEWLYWPEGTPKSVRAYDKGKPTGVWWSWWRTGALRSTYVHEPGVPTPMTWWHPNGLLASQGMAVEGRRVGEWTFWHDNGALESRGEMAGGQRVGFWTFFDEEGEWSERGSYLSGKRRQDWEFRGSLGGTLPFSGRR